MKHPPLKRKAMRSDPSRGRRAVMTAAWTIAGLGAYAGLALGLQDGLGFAPATSCLIAGGALALGWRPVSQRLMSGGWPWSEARAQQAFRDLNRRARDLNQLTMGLLDALERVMPCQRSFLWLSPAGDPSFHLIAGKGAPPASCVIPEFTLRQLARDRTAQAWRVDPQGATSLDQLMVEVGARVCIPLVFQGQLLGLVTLGKRSRGREYGPQDLACLSRLAPHLAEAIAPHQLRAEQAMHLSKLEAVSRLYMDAQRKAITDGLTGLTTHQHFQEELAKRFYEARRYGQPLSLLFLDIDHFKKINDTYGHLTGDEVLRQIAATVQASARACDTVARYGGEELAMLLPQTEQEGAFILAERLRVAIHQLRVPEAAGDRLISVTASIGLAQLSSHDRTPAELLERADRCLYAAKDHGRNRVVRGA